MNRLILFLLGLVPLLTQGQTQITFPAPRTDTLRTPGPQQVLLTFTARIPDTVRVRSWPVVVVSDQPASQAVSAHAARADNPHGVTKAQVGLGSVDNTSDAAKPVSTATQAALNLKADAAAVAAHTANTSNPHGVTAAQVGAYTAGQTDGLLAPKLRFLSSASDFATASESRVQWDGSVWERRTGTAPTAGLNVLFRAGPTGVYFERKTDVLTPQMAGATGDGVADDTQAFQAMLDTYKSSGKILSLYVPPGTYRITYTLTYQTNGYDRGLRLTGAGREKAVLLFAFADGTPLLRLDGASLTPYQFQMMSHIEGLHIKRAQAYGYGTQGAAIETVGLWYATFRQLTIKDVHGHGIASLWRPDILVAGVQNTDSYQSIIRIEESEITFCDGVGVLGQNSYGCRLSIERSRIGVCASGGIVTGAHFTRIVDNSIFGNGRNPMAGFLGTGLHIQRQATSSDAGGNITGYATSMNHVIQQNEFDSNADSHVCLEGSVGTSMDANRFIHWTYAAGWATGGSAGMYPAVAVRMRNTITGAANTNITLTNNHLRVTQNSGANSVALSACSAVWVDMNSNISNSGLMHRNNRTENTSSLSSYQYIAAISPSVYSTIISDPVTLPIGQWTNLLLQSNTFSSASWGKIRAAVASGETLYDGSTNGWKITEDNATGTHGITGANIAYQPNTKYYFWVTLKAGTGRTWAFINTGGIGANWQAGVVPFAFVNLSTGAAGNTQGLSATPYVVNLGSGWYRVRLEAITSWTPATGAPGVYAASANGTNSYAGDGASFIRVAEAQVSLLPGPYVATTTAAVSQVAGVQARGYTPASATDAAVAEKEIVVGASGIPYVKINGTIVRLSTAAF